MKMNLKKESKKKILFWYSIGLFLLTVFSFYNESLTPLIKKQKYLLAFKETVAYFLFLIATIILSSGAYLFLINIFDLFRDEAFLKKIYIIQNKKEFSQELVSKTRKENFFSLINALKPFFKAAMISILIFLFASFLSNE